MAITTSAKKAHRASLKKRVFNMRRSDTLRENVKAVRKSLSAKNPKEAGTLLAAAYKAIDKAAKSNVISKNTAARKKSRLAKAIKKAQS